MRASSPSPVANGAGAPLDQRVRDVVEPVLGVDLGPVRVHGDERSRHVASAVGARAFTVGQHVHLGPGARSSDAALMAHEATHTAQAAPPGPMLLRRDATQGSITRSYAAALDDGGLLLEIETVASVMRDVKPTDDTYQVLNANLATLRAEYVTRTPGANAEAEAPASQSLPPRATEIPDGGTTVGRMGVVSWDGQPALRMRTTRDTSSAVNVAAELPFGTRLLVIKMFPGDWFFVSTPGGEMGYAYSRHVAMDLPEPDARLHRVKPGIPGTAVAIAERYYGEYSRDWGQDLRFYVNVLAWANHIPVPNDAAGWREVRFEAGRLIWIPSQRFAYSLKGAVNSGSISWNLADSAGLAGVIERVAQLSADLGKAWDFSKKFWVEAGLRRIEESARGMVDGLLLMLGIAVLILGASTGAGAIAGGLFGLGAGAAPGAAIGFEVGMVLLEWLGLGMLVVWIGQSLAQVGSAFATFMSSVWDARGDDRKLELAGWQLADAMALTIAKLLEALLMFVMAKGMPKGLEFLRTTRLGRAMGETAAMKWLAARVAAVAKGEAKIAGPKQVMDKVLGRPPGGVQTTMNVRGQSQPFHQMAQNRLPRNLPEGHYWERSPDHTRWMLMREPGAPQAPFDLTVFSDAAGNMNYTLKTGDRMIQTDAITRSGTTYQGADRLPPDLTDTGLQNPYRDPVTGQPWDKGHGIDHADTIEGPGVTLSTTDPANFTPQASWWNRGPRNFLVGRIRALGGGYREMAIYDANPPVTANGTPVPREFIFVETDAAGTVRNAWRIPNQQGAAGRALASINPMQIPNTSVPPVMLRPGPLAGTGGGAFYAPGIVFGVRGDREPAAPGDDPASTSMCVDPGTAKMSGSQAVCAP